MPMRVCERSSLKAAMNPLGEAVNWRADIIGIHLPSSRLHHNSDVVEEERDPRLPGIIRPGAPSVLRNMMTGRIFRILTSTLSTQPQSDGREQLAASGTAEHVVRPHGVL